MPHEVTVAERRKDCLQTGSVRPRHGPPGEQLLDLYLWHHARVEKRALDGDGWEGALERIGDEVVERSDRWRRSSGVSKRTVIRLWRRSLTVDSVRTPPGPERDESVSPVKQRQAAVSRQGGRATHQPRVHQLSRAQPETRHKFHRRGVRLRA